MNTKERFVGICRFERKDDPFIWGIDAWSAAFWRWKNEGMPVGSLDNMKEIVMHLVGYQNQKEAVKPNSAITGMGPLNNPPWVPPLVPMFEPREVERSGNTITRFDYDGALVRIRADEPEVMPQYLAYPVKDRKGWEEYKKRLDPLSSARFPKGWELINEDNCVFPVKEELKGKNWEQRDFPLGMVCLSLWGMPRNYLGLEGISYAMYEDPRFVEEMIEYQTYFAIETIKQVFAAGITFDWAWVWEDMCYKTGSLISPDYVKNIMAPRYRKVVDLLRSHGVEMIILDCDGNIEELLPIWIDCGINATYPLECAADLDALSLRRRYGKDIILVGNIDKRSLAKGKKEIDDEIFKVKELIKEGGYFVNCDHHIPEDVPYENLVYFLNEVHQLSGYEQLRRKITLGGAA